MRRPISFMYGNVVFGSGPQDAWAVYRLATRAYAGLTVAAKHELLSTLATLAYALESDFSVLRVARPWDVEQYVMGVESTTDARHVQREPLMDYLGRQRAALGTVESHVPEVYLSVRLAVVEREGWNVPGLAQVRGAIGLGDARGVSDKQLSVVLAEQTKVHQRILDYLDATRPPATSCSG